MKQSTKRLVASVAVVAALGAACGDDDGNDNAAADTTTTQDSSSSTMATDAGVDSPASTLRANLTAGLQEHVYLAGIAISTAVTAGGNLEDPAVASAVQTLDENSVELSEAVGSVYGDEGGEQFLALWRDHINFFVDYTLGKATGDQAAADEAKTKLDGYRAEFGAFIDSASDGELPSDAVAAELGVHVDSLIVAIDAVVAKSPDAFPKLQEAAAHMPMTAATLAGGITAQMPDEFAGDVDGAAATLRSNLTAGLQEHVYLAGIAISTAVGAGGNLEDPAVASAVQTLDGNSVALSEAVASVYGDEGGEQFLALWRDHINFFVDYTLGKATGDQAMADEAKTKLDDYRAEFGAFIDSASDGELPSDAVAAELGMHVDSLIVAIDAVVAKSPDAFPKLKEAAAHMPMTANTLAGGIVAQMPAEFAG